MRPSIATTLVALTLACTTPEQEPPPPTTTTTNPEPPALPEPAGLIELERTVGSTEPLAQTAATPPAPVPGLEGAPDTSPAAGPADALVHVVLFTDFQCPACRRTVEPLKLLVRRHPEDVRLIVKFMASPLHDKAEGAAAGALAAFRQGAFWPFFDRAFDDARRLAPEDLAGVAATLGLDVEQFRSDMQSEAVRGQVRYETAVAMEFGLSSTPTFVVNGIVHVGWGSYMGIEGVVRRQLERAQGILASGVPREAVAREATRTSDPERGPRLVAALFDDAA